jgi:hypothetical protein
LVTSRTAPFRNSNSYANFAQNNPTKIKANPTVGGWCVHTTPILAELATALGRVDLLILDDWGLAPLDASARHDLLEILEDRYGRRSTLVHQSAAGRPVARADRRPNLRRRRPRSLRQ